MCREEGKLGDNFAPICQILIPRSMAEKDHKYVSVRSFHSPEKRSNIGPGAFFLPTAPRVAPPSRGGFDPFVTVLASFWTFFCMHEFGATSGRLRRDCCLWLEGARWRRSVSSVESRAGRSCRCVCARRDVDPSLGPKCRTRHRDKTPESSIGAVWGRGRLEVVRDRSGVGLGSGRGRLAPVG